jgi:hypothetical protein
MRKIERPKNTPRGAAHHASFRDVVPKPRWTAVTGITCIRGRLRTNTEI